MFKDEPSHLKARRSTGGLLVLARARRGAECRDERTAGNVDSAAGKREAVLSRREQPHEGRVHLRLKERGPPFEIHMFRHNSVSL